MWDMVVTFFQTMGIPKKCLPNTVHIDLDLHMLPPGVAVASSLVAIFSASSLVMSIINATDVFAEHGQLVGEVSPERFWGLV